MNPTNPNPTTQDDQDISVTSQVPAKPGKTEESNPDGYYGDDTDLSNDELDLSFLDDDKPADAE